MKTVKRWKFLRKGMKSQNGGLKWKVGQWQKIDGELEMCKRGLHCSKTPYDAFSFVPGEICALVECRGKHLSDDTKECWSEQRVIKAYKWTKKDSVKLAIFSAKQVLGIFEKKYPEDKRPREAIEAAKRYLRTGSRKGLRAAAYAAYNATYNATYATNAAYAADAAYNAAYATYAANAAYAADAAYNAAYAKRKIIKKIQKYFMELVKGLEETYGTET